MKKYLNTDKEDTKVKIVLSYNIGNDRIKRGYYLHAYPVRLEQTNEVMFEFTNLYTGSKVLVLEVKKQSNKAYDEALNLSNILQPSLIDNVIKLNNLTILNS